MSAASVTGLYVRDGRWYVIVKHGHMFEHDRLGANTLDVDAARREAVEHVVRTYDITKASATKQIAAVSS